MTLAAYAPLIVGQCGIGTWSSIENREDTPVNKNAYGEAIQPYWGGPAGYRIHELKPGNHRGGTGFSGTGFIPTALSKQTYEHMCKNFRLVFQTPVRTNRNSGNKFFYAMFDDGPSGDIATIEPNWPFKDVK